VQQKIYRYGLYIYYRGKGEIVRQELTAFIGDSEGWQTPPGARPNREAFKDGPSDASGLGRMILPATSGPDK